MSLTPEGSNYRNNSLIMRHSKRFYASIGTAALYSADKVYQAIR